MGGGAGRPLTNCPPPSFPLFKHEKERMKEEKEGKERREERRIEQHAHGGTRERERERDEREQGGKEGGRTREGRRIKEEKTTRVVFLYYIPSLLLWLGDGRLETLKINSVNATSTSFSLSLSLFYTLSLSFFLSFFLLIPPARPSANSLISASPLEIFSICSPVLDI